MILPISGYSQKSAQANKSNKARPSFVAAEEKTQKKSKNSAVVDVILITGLVALTDWAVDSWGDFSWSKKSDKIISEIDVDTTKLPEEDPLMDKLLRGLKRSGRKKLTRAANNPIIRKRI